VSEHDDLVLRSDADGVCTLTLNNPERRNAWTVPLENRYFDLLDEADADDDVRAIVLTASGKTFCPGLDAGRLTEIAGTTDGPKLDRSGRRPQAYPLSIRKPLIGAINGSAAGMGLMQALNTDVRFCSSKARFSTAYAKRGLPAEYGSSWILPRIIGLENALDLLLSSRIIDATEAKAMGLVSRVVEPDEVLPRAQGYAAELASICSPASLAAIRQQIYGDLSRTLDEAVTEAHGLLEHLLEGADFAEGVASFLEERPAAFPPLGPKP
jgi:enoyl-CoA hydratase/carnithine racemase